MLLLERRTLTHTHVRTPLVLSVSFFSNSPAWRGYGGFLNFCFRSVGENIDGCSPFPLTRCIIGQREEFERRFAVDLQSIPADSFALSRLRVDFLLALPFFLLVDRSLFAYHNTTRCSRIAKYRIARQTVAFARVRRSYTKRICSGHTSGRVFRIGI